MPIVAPYSAGGVYFSGEFSDSARFLAESKLPDDQAPIRHFRGQLFLCRRMTRLTRELFNESERAYGDTFIYDAQNRAIAYMTEINALAKRVMRRRVQLYRRVPSLFGFVPKSCTVTNYSIDRHGHRYSEPFNIEVMNRMLDRPNRSSAKPTVKVVAKNVDMESIQRAMTTLRVSATRPPQGMATLIRYTNVHGESDYFPRLYTPIYAQVFDVRQPISRVSIEAIRHRTIAYHDAMKDWYLDVALELDDKKEWKIWGQKLALTLQAYCHLAGSTGNLMNIMDNALAEHRNDFLNITAHKRNKTVYTPESRKYCVDEQLTERIAYYGGLRNYFSAKVSALYANSAKLHEILSGIMCPLVVNEGVLDMPEKV
jgi:hypothetical protein